MVLGDQHPCTGIRLSPKSAFTLGTRRLFSSSERVPVKTVTMAGVSTEKFCSYQRCA